jgi:hypothetical protein
MKSRIVQRSKMESVKEPRLVTSNGTFCPASVVRQSRFLRKLGQTAMGHHWFALPPRRCKGLTMSHCDPKSGTAKDDREVLLGPEWKMPSQVRQSCTAQGCGVDLLGA